ncbi:MAG: helix-turn-helix domain-containing protein [Candidatus Nealsonbacteria bacterium]|nr:helix-turn-helix domain-containing protein [Candidatus Nealsonbacteria bacterium]
MTRCLHDAQVHAIMTLREIGWSYRRIALALNVHRETVARHVRQANSKPATIAADSEPKTGQRRQRGS